MRANFLSMSITLKSTFKCIFFLLFAFAIGALLCFMSFVFLTRQWPGSSNIGWFPSDLNFEIVRWSLLVLSGGLIIVALFLWKIRRGRCGGKQNAHRYRST